MKKLIVILCLLLLTACGDFPDYKYDESENYCVMSFPFAGGLIGRKYVGYFNILSTLQYLDADPEIEMFVSGPSHLELETASLIKVEIDDQEFFPEFEKSYLHAETQYYGPAFLFTKEQAKKIYTALQEGNDLTFYGRLEVGKRYETEVYNFFFESDEAVLKTCVNRLLDENDIKMLKEKKNSKSK